MSQLSLNNNVFRIGEEVTYLINLLLEVSKSTRIAYEKHKNKDKRICVVRDSKGKFVTLGHRNSNHLMVEATSFSQMHKFNAKAKPILEKLYWDLISS